MASSATADLPLVRPRLAYSPERYADSSPIANLA
jgi:hypothetical protein